ncbi:Sec-independent protein translocase protein TatB [Roseomonas marmotae]|uniref:Sec-independent protein translocase protein TatB n=1 Tax=Roseomonas marmotae TaxID=2768161 RepID=A0ABS3KCT5_9PROT|nr:Sec-independent protein translocase protein TatB [Roseomonas marmotae]MBO1075271.1 twin-arginine translocase subunit TatB [Roseomonas marmotae]QTI78253.1 twin-arginine translocase subunit TatB [Roseomonas marmotae]
MLDLAWSELALIAVVAVVVIGPKDLPDAIRNVAKGVKKLRSMAAEFQSHADELVKEAQLEDVRQQIQEIRHFDLKGTIERAVDNDGEIRRTFNDDPLKDAWKPTPESKPALDQPAPPAGGLDSAPEPSVTPESPAAPAFIPPTVAAFNADAQRDAPAPEQKPAMIPPQIDGAEAPEKPANPPATPTA